MEIGKLHFLKTMPGYFQAVKRGDKDFEVRKDDRGFQVGDVVVLREWESVLCTGSSADTRRGEYTGDELIRRIKYILDSDAGPGIGLSNGVVVLGLCRLDDDNEIDLRLKQKDDLITSLKAKLLEKDLIINRLRLCASLNSGRI